MDFIIENITFTYLYFTVENYQKVITQTRDTQYLYVIFIIMSINI